MLITHLKGKKEWKSLTPCHVGSIFQSLPKKKQKNNQTTRQHKMYTSIKLLKKGKIILGFGCFHQWETLDSKVSRYRKTLFEQELFFVSHTAVVLFTTQRDKIIASLIRFARPATSKPCGSS